MITPGKSPSTPVSGPRWPRSALTAAALSIALGLGGCGAVTSEGSTAENAIAFFDDSVVHEISVEFSDADYQAMLAAYSDSGDKDWISASVTIDGTRLENVGLRLKGNSSLNGLSGHGTGGDGNGTSESPETLPWLIRTDKFVDGQEYQGRTDLVVRGNNTESSLNEALALEVVGAADLATLEAAATRFSVNGSAQQLRLVIESPDDDQWNEDTFGDDGSIYKAESTGDYTYRGEDPESYTDVFEQKAGETEDLQPVIEFLDFINNSSDEEFSAHLADHLDVDAFARYLAVQELMGNMDDIDGPGNNSYLRYDSETGRMTVVTWDLNLAFGGMGGMRGTGGMPDGAGNAGGPAMPEGTEPPEGFPESLPEGMEPPEGLPEGMERPAGAPLPEGGEPGNGAGMPGSTENPLTTRFHADAEFEAKYEQALKDLRTELYESGLAQEILESWTDLLTEQAADLVSPETVLEESAGIAEYFTAGGTAASAGPAPAADADAGAEAP